MFYHSTLFQKARARAMTFEGDIFPSDCIEILKDVYGARLDRINPETIYKMILTLMDTPDPDELDRKYITEAVNDFINS
jgi:hypothetical protein